MALLNIQTIRSHPGLWCKRAPPCGVREQANRFGSSEPGMGEMALACGVVIIQPVRWLDRWNFSRSAAPVQV